MTEVTDAPGRAPAKGAILEELHESTLLLPSLVHRGIEANERAKYFLTLLQSARAHADDPDESAVSLRDERLDARVTDVALDDVVEQATRVDADHYRIPGVARILSDVVAAVRDMLVPFTAGQTDGAPEPSRLDSLAAAIPDLDDDVVAGGYIDAITSAARDDGDSFHALVMDAHRALNRLHAQIATSTVDGAAVFGLAPGDDALVSAFMDGVHATAPLKFDHPGLDTAATRVGARLVIQNDLGTTNAHVVVIAVDGLTATVTYTDTHLRRLRFFEALLDAFPVKWSDTRDHRGGISLGEHHLTVGRYDGADRVALEAFLRHVGSRLVFVLDWNRARKRLQAFLSPGDAVDALRWAADENLGHIAFLLLGGERLVYDAVERAARTPARYGEPLADVLGHDATVAVTRFALRIASEGMQSGKSQLLVRDELRVEVLRHLQASHHRLLDAGAEHAGLVVESARALHGTLVRLGLTDDRALLERTARRAATWEHRADEILTGQRELAKRVDEGPAVTQLTATADDAIDALEEALFLLTLVPADARVVLRDVVAPVASIALAAAREHLKAVEIARAIVAGGSPEDLEDFLVSVDRVATLEHDADASDRQARAALVRDAPDFRSLYLGDSISRAVEGATDALLRAALGLRDHVLGVLSER